MIRFITDGAALEFDAWGQLIDYVSKNFIELVDDPWYDLMFDHVVVVDGVTYKLMEV